MKRSLARLSRAAYGAALCSALSVALVGCSSAPTRFYTLAARPAAVAVQSASGAPDAASVAVSAVTIPGTLDRPQLVVFLDGERLELFEEARWGEPLAHGIARILAEDLQSRLQIAAVAAYPEDASARARYRISIDVVHLDADQQGEVTLDAIWTMRDSYVAPVATATGDAPPAAVRTTERSRTGHVHLVTGGARNASAASSAEAIVAAQSDAVALLADQLALAFRAFQSAP